MLTDTTVTHDRITFLLQTLLENISFELTEDGAPCLVLSTQVNDIRCSLVCARVKNGHVRLSTREKEIAALIIRGMPNKMIARQLDIRPSTVAAYIKRMFVKLNVCTRAEMVARIFQENLLHSAPVTQRSFNAANQPQEQAQQTEQVRTITYEDVTRN